MFGHQGDNELGEGAGRVGSREAYVRPMGSFVPINRNQPNCANSQEGLQGAITSESNHDQNKAYINTEKAAPKKRGRKPAPKLPLPRAVSLGKVWDYEDEGDTSVQNPGADFQPVLKKRKATPAKRQKPLKSVIQDLNQPESPDEVGDYAGKDEKESQMHTPPDTSNKKRRAISTLRTGEKQTKLFENQPVTKAAPSSTTKYKLPDAVGSPTINYQGWTATQDAVKTSLSNLAPTTLQKLASFKYKTLDTQAGKQLPSSIAVNPAYNTRSHPTSPTPRTVHTSSDYGEFPSSSGFYQDVPHFAGAKNNPSEMSHDQNCHRVEADELDTVDGGRSHGLNSLDNSDIQSKQKRLDHGLKLGHLASVINANDSRQIHDYEPTSSEAAILYTMTNSNRYNNIDDGVRRPSADSIMASNHLRAELEREPEKSSSTAKIQNRKRSSTVKQPNVVVDGQSSRRQMFSNGTEPFSDTDTWIRVSRPHPEMSGRLVQEDMEDNTFDEGIDDEDLLALPSNPAMMAQSKETSLVHSSINKTRNIRSTSNNHHCPISIRSSLSPPLLIGDEFSDSDLEDAMVNLPDPHSHGIEETFEPPSSLPFVFDDDSVTREVYDRSLRFSPPRLNSPVETIRQGNTRGDMSPTDRAGLDPLENAENWSFIRPNEENRRSTNPSKVGSRQASTATEKARMAQNTNSVPLRPKSKSNGCRLSSGSSGHIKVIDDRPEYLPLKQFARPKFPALIRDRSPVLGLSGQTILRVCFRIGELIKEGSRCNALGQDAIIELFARVTFSSRENGTARQHFQFADLFHDHPPFPNGVLPNYKTSGLAESESRIFINNGEMMARCLGRLVRDKRNMSWSVNIINIRPTDWEEVRWTKRIVSGDNSDVGEMIS